jgi:Calcineurin-like phosphoesterase.
VILGLSLWPKAESKPAAVPRGMRIYAIGDIHGRLDLLDALTDRIIEDGQSAGSAVRYLVFLGDYVDRGPQSREVVERLAAGPPPGFGAIHLRGNHEASFQGFLDDTRVGPNWMNFGGLATLASYGVHLPSDGSSQERLADIQAQLRAAVPEHHRRFLAGLKASVGIGDYLFVHAGIRPGVPLLRQSENDLLWIREKFLNSTADHGKVVVHGHTIHPEPQIRPNRIGIDTGAFASGRLTCLVLEGTERRFLATG